MNLDRAVRLAPKWAFGGVNTLREGEAQEYHKMARDAMLEQQARRTPCRMCVNARVFHELTEDNDLSFHVIGDCEKDWRLMIRSGAGRPMEMLVEGWLGKEWGILGTYEPKFCPECGRELTEYRKDGGS